MNQVAAWWTPQPFRAVTRRDRNIPGLASGQSPVPAALLLAVIPLLVFGAVAVSRPTPPVPVKAVRTEGVRVIRMDSQTFSARWRPLYDIAPATVIREVPVATVPAAIEASSSKPPARIVRRASLRPTDVCARHGLRKVETVRGKWKGWRCRR